MTASSKSADPSEKECEACEAQITKLGPRPTNEMEAQINYDSVVYALRHNGFPSDKAHHALIARLRDRAEKAEYVVEFMRDHRPRDVETAIVAYEARRALSLEGKEGT